MKRILKTNPYIPSEFDKDNFYLCGKPHLPILKTGLVNELQKMFITNPPARCISDTKKKKKNRILKVKEIEKLGTELIKCCLTHVEDLYQVHVNRMKGLKIINTLASRAPLEKLPPDSVVHVLWACLSCLHHFLLRLRPDKGLVQWIRRRQARNALDTFDRLIDYLFPMYRSVICGHMMTFFEEAHLWELHFFPATLITRLAAHGDPHYIGEVLVEVVGTSMAYAEGHEIKQFRDMFMVLTEMLPNFDWRYYPIQYVIHHVDRFFEGLLIHDTEPKSLLATNYKRVQFSLLAKCLNFDPTRLESAINRMLELMIEGALDDHSVLVFGNTLAKICEIYCKKTAKRPFNVDIMGGIMILLDSPKYTYSILGHRILHNFVDRSGNKIKLQSPQIFLRNSQYHINLHKLLVADKALMHEFRRTNISVVVNGLLRHGTHKLYVDHVYQTACLLGCEIPCAYTAASCVCFAMSLQHSTRGNNEIQQVHANRIHALILSLLSFVAYLHEAEVFQNYVTAIADRRARSAPHLNPPLKKRYKYAQHHILWDKSSLFFEDWEVRYGMWRCFKKFDQDITVEKIS